MIHHSHVQTFNQCHNFYTIQANLIKFSHYQGYSKVLTELCYFSNFIVGTKNVFLCIQCSWYVGLLWYPICLLIFCYDFIIIIFAAMWGRVLKSTDVVKIRRLGYNITSKNEKTYMNKCTVSYCFKNSSDFKVSRKECVYKVMKSNSK